MAPPLSFLRDHVFVEGLQFLIALDLPAEDILQHLRVRPLENGVFAFDLVSGLTHAQRNERKVGAVDVDELQKHLDFGPAPLVRGLQRRVVPPFLGLQRDLVDELQQRVVTDRSGGLVFVAGGEGGVGLRALFLTQNSDGNSYNSEDSHNSHHNSEGCPCSTFLDANY
jgi:hypothetical protein